MAKKKKTKSASQKKKSAVKVETWVDRLDFVPIEHDSINDFSTTRIRIVSWNILAESYLTPRSHRGLPRLYRNCVFSPRARRAVLYKRLEHFYDLNVDILCLQEVDMPLEILEECGYDSILTPTAREGNGTGGRVDACGIYFQRSKYKSCGHELIRLDDLATLGQTGTTLPISNLQGLSTSFLRRNVALVCRLQHIESNKTIVVANAHCYWNPEYSYVKLCQVHYVMKRAHEFCKEGEGVVFCGDLNSPPHSSVYEYLSRGKVNAKLVAPWYQHSIEQDEEKNFLPGEKDIHQVEDELADLSITAKEEEKENDTSPQIRYMLDFTLNRFTRWLRILGIDAALETEEEEIQRTRENNIVLFERCRKERRTLVTTSYKLLLRKECPSGTYLVNPKSQTNLEAAFVHLLLHHGVTLEPANFLSRCVVCNGCIMDVKHIDDKRRVFAANNAPDLSDELTDVYECHGCGQGYWWCDRPSSSATRVKSQATRLFELCLRGGVPIKGPLNMFDFVDVEKEREKGLEEDDIELEHLDVTDWLKDEQLSCPIPLESSYAMRDDNGVLIGERLPFTNVTFDFVDALDYIMFDSTHFRPIERLYVPTSFKELNARDVANGHLLPSIDWPSDHLAIGAQLELISNEEDEQQVENNVSSLFCESIGSNVVVNTTPIPTIPSSHPPRCACGCVPNILSMFEMAELRKQARLKAAAKSNVS